MKNSNSSRRNFIKDSGKAGLALGLSSTVLSSFLESCNAPLKLPGHIDSTSYKQTALPYNFKGLEPFIDTATMEIHYTKHAASYAKNLDEATTAEGVNTAQMTLENLLGRISKYSTKMRNNAGGHYNHELFWHCMTPDSTKKPTGKLADAINTGFGSFDSFKTQFSDAGKNRFGSGWAWLVLTNDKKLKIGTTPNQDNPLMDVSELKGLPIMGLDVWEHAYYLKYQNKRPDYITNWWNVVNWNWIQMRFDLLTA
jgi:Fe-Mn family superoxide dismutase